jgi:hypothetical protein
MFLHVLDLVIVVVAEIFSSHVNVQLNFVGISPFYTNKNSYNAPLVGWARFQRFPRPLGRRRVRRNRYSAIPPCLPNYTTEIFLTNLEYLLRAKETRNLSSLENNSSMDGHHNHWKLAESLLLINTSEGRLKTTENKKTSTVWKLLNIIYHYEFLGRIAVTTIDCSTTQHLAHTLIYF